MEDSKLITHSDLMFMGLQKIAYVKAVKSDGKDIFAIYAADGTELTTAQNELEAKALVLKNEMRLATLH